MFDRGLYLNLIHLLRGVACVWQNAYADLAMWLAHAYLWVLVIEQLGLAQRDISKARYPNKSTVARLIGNIIDEGGLLRKLLAECSSKRTIIFQKLKSKHLKNHEVILAMTSIKKYR